MDSRPTQRWPSSPNRPARRPVPLAPGTHRQPSDLLPGPANRRSPPSGRSTCQLRARVLAGPSYPTIRRPSDLTGHLLDNGVDASAAGPRQHHTLHLNQDRLRHHGGRLRQRCGNPFPRFAQAHLRGGFTPSPPTPGRAAVWASPSSIGWWLGCKRGTQTEAARHPPKAGKEGRALHWCGLAWSKKKLTPIPEDGFRRGCYGRTASCFCLGRSLS